MKIVILDGAKENPGDLSWDGYRGLGDVTINDDTPLDKVTEQIADAEFILGLPGQTEDLSAEYLSAAPSLRYIGTFSTGYNTIDMDYCHAHGITVCNVPSYGTAMVAQYAVSLLLEVCGHMQLMNDGVHEGKWDESRALVYDVHPLIELDGKTCGIIGFGRIGNAWIHYIRILHKCRRVDAEGDVQRRGKFLRGPDVLRRKLGVRLVFRTLALFLRIGDEDVRVTSVHDCGDGFFCVVFRKQETLGHLRAPIEELVVDGLDLYGDAPALCRGLAFSVTCHATHTRTPTRMIFIIITHWLSRESRQRIIDTALDNVKQYLAGHPVNVVS